MAASDPTQQFWRDPALPYVDSRRACHSRACYRPHSHPTYSIGAVDEGASVFTGAPDGPMRLAPGTLVFVPAARVHACNPSPGLAWSYQMLHLDADWLRSVRHERPGMDTRGEPQEADEPVRIVNDPALYARFTRLNALLFSQADARGKEEALIAFLGDADTSRARQVDTPAMPAGLAEQLRPVLDALRRDYTGQLPLDALARLAGMSRYQLIRAVRVATGMTPHAWQLNERVNAARRRLRAGDGIARVAHDLGFADQAHLQRVFKAHAAVTPGQFRA